MVRARIAYIPVFIPTIFRQRYHCIEYRKLTGPERIIFSTPANLGQIDIPLKNEWRRIANKSFLLKDILI